MKIGLVALGLQRPIIHAKTVKDAFRWGAASAANQVEDAANAEGMDRFGVASPLR